MSATTTTTDRLYVPLPITSPPPPPPPSVSLLIPFDIGQTFVFKSSQAAPTKEWESIFSGHTDSLDWSTDQNELEGFQKPMGWIATWRYFEGSAKPKLDAALTQLRAYIPGELETDRDGIRAIIFPNGIGVMIIRVKAAPLEDPKWSSVQEKAKRKLRRDACRPFLATAAACYLDFMYRAVKQGEIDGNRFIERLRPVGRKHGIVRAEYTYPIYFFDSADVAKWFVGRPAPESTTYGSAKLFIGWRETTIHQSKEDQRDKIERNFIIALAGWFALFVMNNRSTHYILDAIHAIASQRGNADAIEGGAIRLAYMEASNQAFPIQWTSSGPDLLLLEAIHNNWTSSRWWKTVERKTQLLAAHSEQLVADTNDHWNQRITGFGATIACFTLASAIADVSQITGGPTLVRLGLSIGIPAILGILLGCFVWKSLSRPRRSPERWGEYVIPDDAFVLGDTESSTERFSADRAT